MSTPFARSPRAPLTLAVLSEQEATEVAAMLRVLADPARLRLLSLIATSDAGEASAGDLVEPIGRSQPTVSHHLSTLVDAGFLEREKRGRMAWYRVVEPRIREVHAVLHV